MRKKWTKLKAWKWFASQPLPVGFNYVTSTAVNSTEMWQTSTFDVGTIEREMGWAEKYGYNCARIFLPFIVWEAEGDQFLKNVDIVLNICAAHKIKVIPVLFDDCAFAGLEPYIGPQRDPLPLTHNSGWTPSPGPSLARNPKKHDQLQLYVQEIIKAHLDDARILFWDLYNEPGNNNQGLESRPLLSLAFDLAFEVGPTQPLTAGAWGRLNGGALPEVSELDDMCIARSDIVTYHQYAKPEEMIEGMATYLVTGYPVICTEWMARFHFDCTIRKVFPAFLEKKVGNIHWGFVNGRTQTNIPWGWNLSLGDPPVWFHDVLHADGTAYYEGEMNIVSTRSLKL